MFTSRTRLEEKARSSKGPSRFEYLQALVTEFQETTQEEAKEQVLANLANFAYDPINYDWLHELRVIDLFLDCLTEPSERMVEFGMAGLCNCCLVYRRY
mmetsp:Transcript_46648/g.77738  ORF Transcript_46648/g.77738 Transcript_46648/m.77738 type:complete len:99 (+) Transcript_46648:32-328(+)